MFKNCLISATTTKIHFWIKLILETRSKKSKTNIVNPFTTLTLSHQWMADVFFNVGEFWISFLYFLKDWYNGKFKKIIYSLQHYAKKLYYKISHCGHVVCSKTEMINKTNIQTNTAIIYLLLSCFFLIYSDLNVYTICQKKPHSFA